MRGRSRIRAAEAATELALGNKALRWDPNWDILLTNLKLRQTGCLECGDPFVTTSSSKLYCSKPCRMIRQTKVRRGEV